MCDAFKPFVVLCDHKIISGIISLNYIQSGFLNKKTFVIRKTISNNIIYLVVI